MNLSLNINDEVKVVLTDYGYKIFCSYCVLYYNSKLPPWFNKVTNELTIPLWELMNIFGSKMYMGNEQLFIKNEIIVTGRD